MRFFFLKPLIYWYTCSKSYAGRVSPDKVETDMQKGDKAVTGLMINFWLICSSTRSWSGQSESHRDGEKILCRLWSSLILTPGLFFCNGV